MRILIRIVFVIFIAKGIYCLGGVCDNCCNCLKDKKEDEKKEEEKKDDENNDEEINKDEEKQKEEGEGGENNEENNENKKENEEKDEKNEEDKNKEKEDEEKKDEGIMEYEEIKNEGNNTAISLVNYNWFSGKKNLVLKIFKKKNNEDFQSKYNGDKISIKLDENNNPKIFYQKGAEDEPNLEGKKYAFFEINPKEGHTVYLYCSDVESCEFIHMIYGKKKRGIFEKKNHISISVIACDTTSVENMYSMFCGCSSLEKLNFGKNFDTTNVTDMESMFSGCTKLENLNLNNFNTTNVTNMKKMFAVCFSLENLDISNFNTTKVTDMESMFYGCQKLTNLKIGKNFNNTKGTNVKEMFDFCSNLLNDIKNKFSNKNE